MPMSNILNFKGYLLSVAVNTHLKHCGFIYKYLYLH